MQSWNTEQMWLLEATVLNKPELYKDLSGQGMGETDKNPVFSAWRI